MKRCPNPGCKQDLSIIRSVNITRTRIGQGHFDKNGLFADNAPQEYTKTTCSLCRHELDPQTGERVVR